MNVLMISPGYPPEMPFYTRGLSRVGARVIGIGDTPAGALAPMARENLSDYVQVSNLWDEDKVIAELRSRLGDVRLDRIECLWEIGIMLAARLREEFGVEGMTREQAVLFRDKELMKQKLDAAGIRTPRHARATNAKEIRESAARIGYPLIVKPITGAGSADTHKIVSAEALEGIIPKVAHVPEVSVEEFIDGEEFTFDTICSGGEILFYNMSWYRPRPLIGRTLEWTSPQTVSLRRVDQPSLDVGRRMGEAVLKALGFRSGFTHMEWFRTADGEAVFGEIAARAPGAQTVETMNYCCDFDAFEAWAEAVCHGRLTQKFERRYNTAIIFKRAQGQGRIRRIEGLGSLLHRFGEHIVDVELLPVGSKRRNWKQTLLSDGWLIVRHPDLQTTLQMADTIGTDLQMYAE